MAVGILVLPWYGSGRLTGHGTTRRARWRAGGSELYGLSSWIIDFCCATSTLIHLESNSDSDFYLGFLLCLSFDAGCGKTSKLCRLWSLSQILLHIGLNVTSQTHHAYIGIVVQLARGMSDTDTVSLRWSVERHMFNIQGPILLITLCSMKYGGNLTQVKGHIRFIVWWQNWLQP